MIASVYCICITQKKKQKKKTIVLALREVWESETPKLPRDFEESMLGSLGRPTFKDT